MCFAVVVMFELLIIHSPYTPNSGFGTSRGLLSYAGRRVSVKVHQQANRIVAIFLQMLCNAEKAACVGDCLIYLIMLAKCFSFLLFVHNNLCSYLRLTGLMEFDLHLSVAVFLFHLVL